MQFDIQTDTEDAFLEMLIEQSSDDISRHCRRIFALQRYTDTFGGSLAYHDGRYFLANRPVVPGSLVVENGSGLTDDMIDYDAGIIMAMTWTSGQAVISYDAGWILPGWDTGSGSLIGPRLPASIQGVAIQMVNANRITGRLAYSVGASGDVRSETVEGVGTITYNSGTTAGSSSSTVGALVGGLPASLASRLEYYRVPVAR